MVSYAILVLLLAGNLTYLRGGVMPGWRASYRIVVPHPAAAMSEADARAEAYLKPRDRDQAEVIATKISRFTVPL